MEEVELLRKINYAGEELKYRRGGTIEEDELHRKGNQGGSGTMEGGRGEYRDV